MFHDSACFPHMACICHFIFMSCPEPPMGISSVGSFAVWSGGSLIIFSSSLGVGILLEIGCAYIRGRHGGLSD